VRKRVQATAQLYWEGEFFPGELTEFGAKSLRIELDSNEISSTKTLHEEDLEKMQQDKPLVGLLVTKETTNPSPKRLLAEVVAVEILPVQENSGSTYRKVALELNFPEKFKQRQADKIKQLLKVL
jgi:cellulose synthase (UDP-forming)